MNFFLARSNTDTKTNNFGYWLIDIYVNDNLFIVNGKVGKDKGAGHKKFRDTSTIDYTLCAADCFSFLTYFVVVQLDPVFSDGHALLSWSLNVNKLNCH